MNNTFNFTRFKKVLARDFRATYKRFGLAALILSLLVVTVWILYLVWGNTFHYNWVDYQIAIGERFSTILSGIAISFAIAPATIYKSCNLKGRGNYYAMLPASHLEKYLSMFFYCCIVAPLAVLLGSFIVDTLLTLLPIGYFKGFIWNWSNFSEDYFVEYISSFIAFLFLTSSIFMFTNTLFKRAKFIKTALWLMLIGFVLLITGIAFPALFDFIGSFWVKFIIMLIISFVLQFFTYRRLKRMQY
ncbi:MAG: hypothetical protein IKQ94_03795 [Bacteroidales bacterium]|nr:hypothetical protein [Bacteroidales bacterium]